VGTPAEATPPGLPDPPPPEEAPGRRRVAGSLLFAAGQAAATVAFALAGLLTAPLSWRWRYAFITRWSRLNLWWLRRSCGLAWRVEGLERLPPGPAVVLSKHQSAFETLLFQLILPPQTWVLKRELLWIPFFGWGLALLEPIAIDRKAGREAVRRLLAAGRRRLAQGRWVIVFPEGTRVPPGQRRRYGLGGALLAEHARVPVVPVAHNAGEYWPRRGLVKREGVIRVAVGPVIEARGRRAPEILAEAEAWIEAATARLSHLGGGGGEGA